MSLKPGDILVLQDGAYKYRVTVQQIIHVPLETIKTPSAVITPLCGYHNDPQNILAQCTSDAVGSYKSQSFCKKHLLYAIGDSLCYTPKTIDKGIPTL